MLGGGMDSMGAGVTDDRDQAGGRQGFLTQQELVGQRLGLTHGRQRSPSELIALVFQLSEMLSVRLSRLSTAFLTEVSP